MKLSCTRFLLFTTAIAFYFLSCKKSVNNPAPVPATDYSAVSKQIALNLMQGLTGEYGGTNINDGLKTQSNITTNHKGQVLFRKVPLCGFTIDTSYNNKIKAGDTAKTFIGNFKFVNTCTTGRPDGYMVRDSLVTLATSGLFKNSFISTQDYAVQALDTTYKVVSTNGSITSATNNLIYRDGFSVGYDYNFNSYKLNGLKVDFSDGKADIITGAAEFTSTTSYMHFGETVVTEVNTSGTITFLGNHKASLNINGQSKTYLVDLLTRSVTVL
ncbi:hypothetical protein [Mucilaginibacter xinganensis]|uniref:Lipoprotein n=1 Tax=Mucilaginibacter xinganensis TaxID=1234841 RepID=A0A223P1Q1_9SPHI|nr:hypothetical protein [Mucilaginibacter xinganensis]ASU36055.1 hypothetical protein MuYL_4170 [Mucilaginibacter xinganensis]